MKRSHLLGVAALAALLAGCGASGRSDGTQLSLLFAHDAGKAVTIDAGGRHFTDAAGRLVTLSLARLTVESVEVFPCPSTAARLLRLLSPIGVARAHGVTTDSRLAVPHVHDLAAADGTRADLGAVRPLPGSYCSARVVFGPADADAPGADALGMVGKTLELTGQIAAADGSNPVPFSLVSSAQRGADVPFASLALQAGDSGARAFTLTYGGWLDGIDVTAADAADRILDRVALGLAAGP